MSAYILSRFEGLRNLLPVGVSPGRHRRREDSVSGADNRLARLPARLQAGTLVIGAVESEDRVGRGRFEQSVTVRQRR